MGNSNGLGMSAVSDETANTAGMNAFENNLYSTDVTTSLDMFADFSSDLATDLGFAAQINVGDFDITGDFNSNAFFDGSSFTPSTTQGQSTSNIATPTDAYALNQLSSQTQSTSNGSQPSAATTQAPVTSNVPHSMPGPPHKHLSLDTSSATQPPLDVPVAVVPRKHDAAPNSRKRIPPEKTLILETSFQNNPKPDRETRDSLAHETGLPVRNIQVSAQCALLSI